MYYDDSVTSNTLTEENKIDYTKTKGANLVMFSNRESGGLSPMLKYTMGEGADMTHKNTFGGTAITTNLLDLPEKLKKNKKILHIKADATSKNFCKHLGKPLSNVFMELPEPSVLRDTIDNISKQMLGGANLEIEHSPSIIVTDKSFMTSNVHLIEYKLSPFNFFINYNLFSMVHKLYSQKIDLRELEFKVDKSIFEYIVSGEMEKAKKIVNHCSGMFIKARMVFQGCALTEQVSFFENFVKALDEFRSKKGAKIFHGRSREKQIKRLISELEMIEKNPQKIICEKFLNTSLLISVWKDTFMLTQSKGAKKLKSFNPDSYKCLSDSGDNQIIFIKKENNKNFFTIIDTYICTVLGKNFDDVQIFKRKGPSPYNGRMNQWVIKAKRKALTPLEKKTLLKYTKNKNKK